MCIRDRSPTDAPTLAITEPPSEDPGATATATEEAPPAPGLDGEALKQDRCTVCHSLARVEAAHKTAEQWLATVNRMIGYGAVLSAEELDVLVQYLAETYP